MRSYKYINIFFTSHRCIIKKKAKFEILFGKIYYKQIQEQRTNKQTNKNFSLTMTDYKSLYEQSQKENKELKEKFEYIEQSTESSAYAELEIERLKKENEELQHECATRQADYDEKCKELEGLEDMEAKVTDALWDEATPECRVDLVVADIHKLRKENEKYQDPTEAESHIIKTMTTGFNEEIKKLKETLEKKDKQIALLVRNKKNREKQLIHIRAICENTDEYIEEKVCEKMDEYIVKKQNDTINKLKELLNEAEPYLSHYKGVCSVSGECKEEEKLDDLLVEIENI